MEYLIGRRNKDLIEAILKHIQTFHIVKDMKPYIVTKEEGIKAGIPKYLCSKSFIIVYDDAYFNKYTTTVDKVKLAANDFSAGWFAAKAEQGEKVLHNCEIAVNDCETVISTCKECEEKCRSFKFKK